MSTYLRALPHLLKALTSLDKIIISTLLVGILVSGLFWRQSITRFWQVKPIRGGSYTEGIISTDPFELDLTISKLTRIGLTYIDHAGHINGALADHWETSPDGKVYTFHLRPKVNAQAVASIYGSQPNWQNIPVQASDAHTLTISLNQPFAPLLSFTSDPVFAAGPYMKDKQTANEITFTANKDFVLGEPNLQHIVLVLYPDERTLKAALQRQEVMGADREVKGVPGTHTEKLNLTKQTVLFFNLEKPIFSDKKLREQIKNHQKLDKPLSITLATSQDPHLIGLANQFAKQMKPLGLTVSIDSRNPIVLDRDVLQQDNYDMLLADINYGYDQDPYPYWHSSQILPPGKNYAGYNSRDADKLIEDARQSLNESERLKKYEEFQKILQADVPAIFYPKQDYHYTVSSRLKGVSQGIAAVQSDRFTEVWRWFVKAKREKK